MGLYSSLELFELLQEKGDMNFLITYKLSKDHLETFFSAIRGKGGYNNNSTCRQFKQHIRSYFRAGGSHKRQNEIRKKSRIVQKR
jgi:hypothetical protein